MDNLKSNANTSLIILGNLGFFPVYTLNDTTEEIEDALLDVKNITLEYDSSNLTITEVKVKNLSNWMIRETYSCEILV